MRLLKNTGILLFIVIGLVCCRKDRSTTDKAATITVSADTLGFDTVFATAGSVTQLLKLFNNNNGRIIIQSIRLAGGAASPFKINVNGTPGPVVENVELAPGDSAYIFATVTVNPNASATAFLVRDSLLLTCNGNLKKVQLQAYGQNAHFLRHQTITANETWTADLPYVVLDTLRIAEAAHLTIAAGCRIYFHAGAPMVVEGQLTVQGNHWDSTRVVFTGDRLDVPYRDLPGSWPGIVFKMSSHNNSIQYGVLKNATQAIAVDASPLASKIALYETIIDNASDAGIIASGATLTARNLLVTNCGRNIVLQNGGDYRFLHATVASFSTLYLPHKEPVLQISNTSGGASLNAFFQNCIFWGENGNVVPQETSIEKTGTASFNVQFDGVLWPLQRNPENASAINTIAADPEFEVVNSAENIYDFHLKETSPARNSGVSSSVPLDLDGRQRPVGLPDLGAYEQQ